MEVYLTYGAHDFNSSFVGNITRLSADLIGESYKLSGCYVVQN